MIDLRRCDSVPGARRLCMLVTAGLLAAGCHRADSRTPEQLVEGGDAARGRAAMEVYGCGSCHTIPGVRAASGMVEPALEHWSQRRIIAGAVPNDPARLITWLTVPQSIQPGSAMPNMGVNDGQARDMAAYLYTLR